MLKTAYLHHTCAVTEKLVKGFGIKNLPEASYVLHFSTFTIEGQVKVKTSHVTCFRRLAYTLPGKYVH